MAPATPPRRLALLLGLLLLAVPGLLATPAAGASTCDFPVTAVDATGTTVTIDAEPAEVVTLAPSAAQTMWEIGAKDKVIGVSPQAAYLSGADSRTEIANYPSVDAETVVALDPDLVLTPNAVADEDVERLRSLGLTVYKFEAAETIEDVYAKTTLTGRLVGACDGAADTVASMKTTIDAAVAALEGRERPPGVYHMGGGWTAGGGTFIDELIATGGGENIATAAGVSGYQVLSAEVMLERDPHWFIRGSVPVPDVSPYDRTTAGRNDRVIVVDANYMNQPAPRIVQPIVTIAETLHPDVDIEVAGGGVAEDLTEGSASHTTRVTVDGALEVAVTGLYADRSYRVDLPADAGPNAGDGVELRAIDLALAEPNPDFLLRVEDPGSGGPAPADGDRRTLRRLRVTPNGLLAEDVASVTYRVTVPAAALDGADQGSLALSLHAAGSWERLDATVTRSDGQLELVATADALGTIAVTAPAAEASVPTTTATAPPTTSPTPTPSPTPTTRPDDGSTATPTAAAGTTSADAEVAAETSGQPGFGPLAALAALLTLAALRRRGRA